MKYKLSITSPDESDFLCEIAIDGEQSFSDLHNQIIKSLKYDSTQMASFFMLDKAKNRTTEIALLDMGNDEDTDHTTILMDETFIRDVVAEQCKELEYIFDFFEDKYLTIKIQGEYQAPLAKYPTCLRIQGTIPQQGEFNMNEDWLYNDESKETANNEEDYDDSFMEEFGGDENYRSYNSSNDDEYDKYENLDDYIDRI